MRKGSACLAVASMLLVSVHGDSCGNTRWEEHANQYMSCFAGEDTATGTLADKKAQCCQLGDDCLGVTCKNLHEDCSVRNHKACEGGEFLSPSEDETTYVKVVDFTPSPPQASCDNLKLDVKKSCSSDGCKVLAENMRLRTCSQFCKENGLVCTGAWEEKDDTCEEEKSWLCDEPYLDSSKAAGVLTSDLLCECASAAHTPAPPVRPPPPPPLGHLPRCHWTEHPNTYISCHTGGEVDRTDMLRAQKQCEDLGDNCAGVTCEGLWDRCTTRNNGSCDQNDFLKTSPDGETSYTKDCSGPHAVGSCADLTDVKQTCGDPCKVLVTNMRGKTCSQYCFHHGLRCVAAWEEENDSCTAQQTWLCDQPFTSSSKAAGVWTSDLICECMPPTSPPPVSMCTWTRYDHAFISCHAAGDTDMGSYEDRKQRCEGLGEACAGVTCEGDDDTQCTVRHHEACDAKQFLAPSENEHSYVKKCGTETGACTSFAKQCPGGGNKACKGLVEWLEGTCEQHCSKSGMTCTGAWQATGEGTCNVDFVGECARVLTLNRAICECSYAGPTPVPTPPVTAPLSPDRLPKCRWSEHPHAYISCFASGEKTEGDLIAQKLKCEQMGKEQCAGLTCRGLFTECTLRHNKNCDQNAYLEYSEEETSYVLEECGGSGSAGSCAAMPDVVKSCGECKALVTNMRGVSCTQYCQQAGLKCKSAAEEKDDSCEVYQEWLCDQPFLDSSKAKGTWTSDLICECEAPTATSVPVTPLPARPPGLTCQWRQLPNTYISCEAQITNDPQENKRQLKLHEALAVCESAQTSCEGVTCEAGLDMCTVRDSNACDAGRNQPYPTSPSGEVSYLKDCGDGAMKNGVCEESKLTDAQKLCGTPCSVLAFNLRDRSCAKYCREQGLVCMSAFVPASDPSRQCSGERTLMCDESPPNGGDTAICNCGTKDYKKQQDNQQDNKFNTEVQKHQSTDLSCAWSEYAHSSPRCSESNDKIIGDLIEREQACEKDSACIAVVCEGLHARCMTRVRGSCTVAQTKQFRVSEDETTYLKNCTPVPPGGNCNNLKNVKQECTQCTGGGQKVLATNMRGKSCAQYCREAGMACTNAWEEKDDSCEVDQPWICSEPYLSSSKAAGTWTSDLICECSSDVNPTLPSNPAPSPSGGGSSSVLTWFLALGIIGAVGLVAWKGRSYLPFGQGRSYAGFQPVRPVALDDDEEEGLFGEDAQEEPASQDGDGDAFRIPAPPKEKSGPEL